MRLRSRLARVGVTVAVAIALVGCSSSSETPGTSAASTPGSSSTAETSPTSTAPTHTVPADTVPADTVPPSSGESSTVTITAATTAATSPTDDIAAITAAFTTFFDGINPDVDGKVAVLENGESMRSMIVDAAADPQFQQLSTVVNSVTLLSDSDCAAAAEAAPCAKVAHDMFVGGLPAMVGLESHAVKVEGVWKVSAKSWCAIVAIGGATCPTTTTG